MLLSIKQIVLILLCLSPNLPALEKSLDVSANGPTLILSAQSNKITKIQCIFIVSSISTTFYLSSGSTALHGPIWIQPYGAFYTPVVPGVIWFTLNRGEDLYITQTGSAQLSGRIYYTQEL